MSSEDRRRRVHSVPSQPLKIAQPGSTSSGRPVYGQKLAKFAKIAKINGTAQSSPMITRRKTTSSHPLTRSRGHRQNSISDYGSHRYGEHMVHPAARPLSWHPDALEDAGSAAAWMAAKPAASSSNALAYESYPFVTTEVHGLVTPLAQPSSGQLHVDQAFSPLDHTSDLDSSNIHLSDFPSMSSRWNPPYEPIILPSSSLSQPAPEGWSTDHQQFCNYASMHDPYFGTAPPTPQLPAQSYPWSAEMDETYSSTPPPWEQVSVEQSVGKGRGLRTAYADGHEAELTELEVRGSDEVLVGMGLYDPPPSPATTTTFSTQKSSLNPRPAGKGLKLEESFEPPSPSDETREHIAPVEPAYPEFEAQESQDDVPSDAFDYMHSQLSQATELGHKAQSFFVDDRLQGNALLPFHPFVQDYPRTLSAAGYSGAPWAWI